MPAELFYTDRAALLENLQAAICAQLQRSLEQAPRATLLLSGGDSPGPLYRSLASANLPWDRIDVALVDERWVPDTHEASNARLVRETLLRDKAAAARFTGMWIERPLAGSDEEFAVNECNRAYKALARPWSVALLGMGPDGHAASLFPNADSLRAVMESKRSCEAMHAPAGGAAGEFLDRMTMTPHALLQCEQLFLFITGRDKRVVYEKALATTDQATMPVSVFLQQNAVPLTVYWSP